MKCILCIMEEMKNIEITGPEKLASAVDQAVDGAKVAITVIRGNALCNGHFGSEVIQIGQG